MSYEYSLAALDAGQTFTQTTHHDTYTAIDSSKADLSGKIVFVTGSSKGVGRATAISYAKAGASGIVISGRSDLSEAETAILSAAASAGKSAPKVLKINLDVTELTSVKDSVQLVEKEFGKLDILINNAGYLSSFDKLAETDPREWWMNWEINLRGVYWVTKEFLPLLLKGGEKTIVNVSSTGAHTIVDGASGYQTSKFALLRFTEFICVEYASQGILAFCIHPGGVVTDLAKNMPKERWNLLNDTSELAADTLTSLTAERRVWLAGRYVSVCWDMPELYSREEEIVKEDKLKMRMRF